MCSCVVTFRKFLRVFGLKGTIFFYRDCGELREVVMKPFIYPYKPSHVFMGDSGLKTGSVLVNVNFLFISD
jgi:hypothetical protein